MRLGTFAGNLALLPLTLIALAGSAHADSAQGHWLHYRVSQLSVLQTGGNFFSGMVSFNPELSLGKTVAVVLGTGGSFLKSQTSGAFGVLEYQLGMILHTPSRFAFELSYGRQIWLENGGNHPLYSLNLLNDLGGRWLDRMFLGYAYYALTDRPTHEIRVGLCF